MIDLKRVQDYVNLGFEKEEAVKMVREEEREEEKKEAKAKKTEEKTEEKTDEYVTQEQLKTLLQEIALKKETVPAEEKTKRSTAEVIKNLIK